MNTNKFIVEKVSPFDVATTVEKLISESTKREWTNPATHNFQQSLAKSGKEIRAVQVVEICKPEYSGKMLEKNDERIVSVFMPCRISVYEKEDGKTYVAFMNTNSMSEGMLPSVIEAMQHVYNEMSEIVDSVI